MLSCGVPLSVTNAGDRYSMKYEMRDDDTHAMFLDALRSAGLTD